MKDHLSTIIAGLVLWLVALWMVAPTSWTDTRGCAGETAPMQTVGASVNAKLEAVLGPPGTLVENGLLRAALELPATADLTAGYVAITVDGVRRVFRRSPTRATWIRTE